MSGVPLYGTRIRIGGVWNLVTDAELAHGVVPPHEQVPHPEHDTIDPTVWK